MRVSAIVAVFVSLYTLSSCTFHRDSPFRSLYRLKQKILLMKLPIILAKLEMLMSAEERDGGANRGDSVLLQNMRQRLEGIRTGSKPASIRTRTRNQDRFAAMVDRNKQASGRPRPILTARAMAGQLGDEFIDLMAVEQNLSPKGPHVSRSRLAVVRERLLKSINGKILEAAKYLDNNLTEDERKVVRYMPMSSMVSLLDSLPDDEPKMAATRAPSARLPMKPQVEKAYDYDYYDEDYY
ncbi:hypothetical protein HDE_13994 [Halotydeus destructor]|nr:hypothetical protein HDE_13994 [Halotydeus destructor]